MERLNNILSNLETAQQRYEELIAKHSDIQVQLDKCRVQIISLTEEAIQIKKFIYQKKQNTSPKKI